MGNETYEATIHILSVITPNMWVAPIPYHLTITDDSESFRRMGEDITGLPIKPHPGAFGVERKNHTHEGVDLYVPEGTPVTAVEDGEVIAVVAFTGPSAIPPSDWWHDTQAVLIYNAERNWTVLYGEVAASVRVGDKINQGDLIGHVKQVLTKDKGRPMSMLHFELYIGRQLDGIVWEPGVEYPPSEQGMLADPTDVLFFARTHPDVEAHWRANRK